MLRLSLTVVALAVALSHAATVAAQSLPAGGYYADGAYYLPSAPPAAAPGQVAPDNALACPLGYGVPTLYVASTATTVRIRSYWPASGDSPPGYPYLPVYPAPAAC